MPAPLYVFSGGIFAGAMYWLVTGCKAGFLRDTIAPPEDLQ
jgi:hypothetical protein